MSAKGEAEMCENCRFWVSPVEPDTTPSSSCRKRAPWALDPRNNHAVFPQTPFFGWCGDHERTTQSFTEADETLPV